MSNVEKKASRVKHEIDELGETVVEKTKDLANKGSDMVKEYGDEVVKYIKKHPVESIVIGTAIGTAALIFLGKFLFKN